MTITAREAFERGTKTFNSYDIDGFAEVLSDDVVFEAPGGLRGQGKAACIEFYGSWFGAFPDAHVDVHFLHIMGDVAVEEGTFTGTHNGVLKGPMGDVPPTGRPVRIAYIQVLRFRDGKHGRVRRESGVGLVFCGKALGIGPCHTRRYYPHRGQETKKQGQLCNERKDKKKTEWKQSRCRENSADAEGNYGEPSHECMR
jgi:ketosteroid isomerase-like protein